MSEAEYEIGRRERLTMEQVDAILEEVYGTPLPFDSNYVAPRDRVKWKGFPNKRTHVEEEW